MMAASARLAGATARPRRSILFVAFTGEEKGWAGSRAVAARAPKTVVAMLNLDMVGRMKGNALEVNGSATSASWRAIVDGANVAGAGAVDALALSYPRPVPSGSDHQPFILKEVPALFLFTGMHCDYHRGSDTWDKINVDGVVKVAKLVAAIARIVADRAQRLEFEAPTWTDRRPPMGCAP
jgi:Zn-dependent M28 family amino/carboxypeptidase